MDPLPLLNLISDTKTNPGITLVYVKQCDNRVLSGAQRTHGVHST